MRLRTVQTNFASGELDPLMHFRADTGAYKNGAASLLNALLYSTGGCARRPPTRHCDNLVGETRLVGFDFSSTERYVLGFSNGRLDVFDTEGALLTSITSGCNWDSASLREFTYTQAADTMFICHRDWQNQVITRTGLNTFIVEDFAFTQSTNGEKIYQPYFKFVDDDVTISLSATTGAGVTCTASATVFTADMVGQRIRWKETELEVTAFVSTSVLTVTVKGTAKARLAPNPFRTTEGSSTVEVTHVAHGFATGDSVTFSGSAGVGGLSTANLNGARTITVTSDNTYTIVAGGSATSSEDGGGPSVEFTGANLPTRDWGEPVFCDRNGWPGAVSLHDARLWFAGTYGVPNGVWSSRLFRYYDFDVGDGSSGDSVQYTVGADDFSQIRHLVSNEDLQIFTVTGEFYAPAPRDSTLTPANFEVRRQTPYGSSVVRPQHFDGATVYIQQTGTALREFLYTEATARYASTNLNVLSAHLINSPIDMSVLYASNDRNEQYALVINGDGTMAVLHSSRAEQLAGWTPWELGGEGSPAFSSVCVLGGDIFFSVLRHGTYRLEKLSSTLAEPGDGGVVYTDASAKSDWIVGAIFYGRTVGVWSGDYYLGEYTVGAAGALVLDVEVARIVVGYPSTFQIEILPVALDLATGPMTGLPKRICRVVVGLDSALALSISGNRLILRQVTDDLSLPPAAKTGTHEFRLLGFQRDAIVTVTQDEPLPVRVLGMMMEVQF